MIEFIPNIVEIVFPLAVGMSAFSIYQKSQKTGLMLVSVAFFLSAVPSIVKLALGGPYMILWLHDQGYTVYQLGMIQLFLWIFGAAFQAVFAILVIAGLVKLSKQA